MELRSTVRSPYIGYFLAGSSRYTETSQPEVSNIRRLLQLEVPVNRTLLRYKFGRVTQKVRLMVEVAHSSVTARSRFPSTAITAYQDAVAPQSRRQNQEQPYVAFTVAHVVVRLMFGLVIAWVEPGVTNR